MGDEPVFKYLQLFMQNVAIWPFVAIFVVWRLVRNPETVARFSTYISRVKVGSIELELRQVQAVLAETKEQVAVLENEVERGRTKFDELLDSFDINVGVSSLAEARQALKSMAPSMDDLTPVRNGLAAGATDEQLYAAAEIVRARRDVGLFDDLVSCLDRLATDPNLLGIRLYTVWTLTSALHRTLIADMKHAPAPSLTRAQLLKTRSMLARLRQNTRVQGDRPDAPMKGVLGPTKWAEEWVEKGLRALDAVMTNKAS